MAGAIDENGEGGGFINCGEVIEAGGKEGKLIGG